MTWKKMVAFAALAAASFALGQMSGTMHGRLHPATLENLSTAMHGEAFAHAKYLLFAEHARAHGNPELAELFEDAAKTEKTEHFAQEAALAGIVGSDADNLRDAVEAETYEAGTMYPTFAREADKVGDHEAALRFREIASDEARHRDAFQAELKRLEAHEHAENH